MAPIRKLFRFKTDELFQPVQLHGKHRLPPKGLHTCNAPLRRSSRLREKSINRKVDCSSIPPRPSPTKAKVRGDRGQGQSQLKSLSTKRKSRNQPHPLLTSRRVRGDCKRPETRDKQEIEQGVQQNKGNPIEQWLGTFPLSLENLVDPFKQNTSDNIPQNSGLPSASSLSPSNSMPRTATPAPFGVRGPKFRAILGERNIFINEMEPSIELVKRAKKIFTDETFSKMDDSLAEKLALVAKTLETKSERVLIRRLVAPLFLDITEVPVQSLETSEDKLWVRAKDVPLEPDSLATPFTLPMPRPDVAFGYPKKSFNKSQLNAIKLLVTQSLENYAMPDEAVIFPFVVVEAKAQSAHGTQFVASNQAAHAGAVAMLGILNLAQRISAEEEIDLDQPQFFSISIDYAMAYINAHWLSRDTENGAFCFHMGHIERYFLDADGLKAVNLAAKNILHYGVNQRRAKICRDLDTYLQKIKEKATIDQSNLASDLLPEEQH